MIKAILFDLDGVLCQTCDWHKLAFNQALEEISNHQITEEEHLKIYNGLPTKQKLQKLIIEGKVLENQFDAIWQRKQELTEDLIIKNSTTDSEKIFLHQNLQQLKIIEVCVTNCIRSTAELMLEKTGQLKYLEFLITNQDISKPKPDPEPYLLASERLINSHHIKKEEMLIIEDSDHGYQAAIKSGIETIKVLGPEEVNFYNFIKWSQLC